MYSRNIALNITLDPAPVYQGAINFNLTSPLDHHVSQFFHPVRLSLRPQCQTSPRPIRPYFCHPLVPLRPTIDKCVPAHLKRPVFQRQSTKQYDRTTLAIMKSTIPGGDGLTLLILGT